MSAASLPASRLNYRHLQAFWAVAREGHLTRAAQALHVAPSALSAQIRELEERVGHALFDREGRALRLTEAGRLVLGYADGIFALGDELVAALRSGVGAGAQPLRIGSVATLSRNFQDNFLQRVLRLEAVRLVLESGSFEALLERLAVHKLDLVLSNRPVAGDATHRWRCRRIARQPVCLVGPPRPGMPPFRFPQDLAGARLLLPGYTSDIRVQFDLLCQDMGFVPEVFAEVDDMAMLRLLARDSGGVALLPAVVVQDELRQGTLQQYAAVPKLYETFYAITIERRFQPDLLKRLLAKR